MSSVCALAEAKAGKLTPYKYGPGRDLRPLRNPANDE